MRRLIKLLGIALLATVLVGAAVVAFQSWRTERAIDALAARVAQVGLAHPVPVADPQALATLPEPVRRYFGFTFRGAPPRFGVVRLAAAGTFRRPRTESFNPTTAEQVIAVGVPALMFSATTAVLPGLWARAYDFFADGQMEMKARILSTLTVVNERENAELNRISLRRWLLEAALYPSALLPGGPVTWQPIDAGRARATVSWRGLEASMVAHFDAQGRMTQMVAESDGDLGTPYHGSGEHVARSNYQPIGSQMIPMDFTISRMAGGRLYPFWKGTLTRVTFE